MNDMYYVNILNDKMIPWIQEKGPLFGYKVSIGVLSILRKDPTLNIVVIHSPEEAEQARRKWYGEDKKPIILHDEVSVAENVDVSEPLTVAEEVALVEAIHEADEQPVEEEEVDEVDAAIAASLEAEPFVPADVSIADAEKLEEAQPFKKYTRKQLEGMTKAELKNILNVERGFASFTKLGAKGDKFGGKYHDSVETLIKKVLDSQK